MEVGEVIQFYDSDRRFPAWGFGGHTGGAVSHCFNLNGSPGSSEVRVFSFGTMVLSLFENFAVKKTILENNISVVEPIIYLIHQLK